MIRTVFGDINKEQLGTTMCHEHFIIDLDRIRHDGESMIETVDEVVPEIKLMMDLGVEATVEVSTIDLGRDVLKLREISKQTGLKIICSTGFYLSQFHPEWLNEATAQKIADVYIKELTKGIDGSDIKAGIIGEIASSSKQFTGQEKKILVAAGIAAKKVGCAVSTHTSRYTAFETVDILLNEGVNPDKIIIGHQDLIDDTDYHLDLLKKGVNIAFDTCGKKAYMPDETRAKNIIKLIEAGYEDHLLLSNDISRRSYFVSHGNLGYTPVMGIVVPLLREYGLHEEKIRKLLIDNPARILDNDWQ